MAKYKLTRNGKTYTNLDDARVGAYNRLKKQKMLHGVIIWKIDDMGRMIRFGEVMSGRSLYPLNSEYSDKLFYRREGGKNENYGDGYTPSIISRMDKNGKLMYKRK